MKSSFIFELTLRWKRPLLVSCGESQLLLLFHPHNPSLQESVRKLNEMLPFGATWKKSTGQFGMETANK
jgi:hypothetical protein